ncbi:MAG: hypothetical protein AB7O59_22845 [Pirellulales bacterium]
MPQLAAEHRWHLHFLTSGRGLTTFVRRAKVALWIINTIAPDATGRFLLQTVREYFPKAMLFVVTDRYDVEHEGLACQSGAALYLCKDDTGGLCLQPFLMPLRSRDTPDESKARASPEFLEWAPAPSGART